MCAQESPRTPSVLLTSTDPTGEQLTFRPSEVTVSIGLNNTIRWHNTGYPTTISNQEGVYDSLKFPFNDIKYQVLDKPGKYIFFDESNPAVKVNVTVIPLDQDYNPGAPITKYSIFPDVRFQTFRIESDAQNFINKISILNHDTIAVTLDNTMDEQYWISDNEKILSPLMLSIGDKVVTGCTFHYEMYSRIFYHELQEINSDNNTVTFQESLGFEPGNKCITFYENPINIESTIEEFLTENISPLKQYKSGIPVNEIQCNSGLQKMLKHDGSPVCVTPRTAEKLTNKESRGSWDVSNQLWELLSKKMDLTGSEDSCPKYCLTLDEDYLVEDLGQTLGKSLGLPQNLPKGYEYYQFYHRDSYSVVQISKNPISLHTSWDNFYWKDSGIFIRYSKSPITSDAHDQTAYWAKTNGAQKFDLISNYDPVFIKARQIHYDQKQNLLYPTFSEAQFNYEDLSITLAGYISQEDMLRLIKSFEMGD